jgi:hypothetical protein
MIGAMASDPQALSLSIRPLARLAQDEERRRIGAEARSRRGLGQRTMVMIASRPGPASHETGIGIPRG